jgi:ELWxxDGT repeat protein
MRIGFGRRVGAAVFATACVLLGGAASAGTQASAHLVKDILDQPSAASSSPYDFAVVNDRVLFFASTPTAGAELWSTDGSESGTQQVVDIEPGAETANLADLTRVGDLAFFTRAPITRGGDEADSFELWKTDGTASGTVLVETIPKRRDLRGLADLNGILIFAVYDDPQRQLSLWRSDGTARGTRPIMEVPDVPFHTPFDVGPGVTRVGDLVLFNGYAADTGFEPWRSDGTRQGTFALGDLTPGPDSSVTRSFTATAHDLFLVNGPANSGPQTLWVSDGGRAGTRAVKPALQVTSAAATINDALYFFASTGQIPSSLWVSDGTDAGTQVVTPGGGFDLLAAGNHLFFTVHNSGAIQMWTSDGTSAGTIPVTDPATPPYAPFATAAQNGIYFIRADAGEQGAALWWSDGSPSGTRRVQSVRAPEFLGTVGDRVYFSQIDDAGQELWKSDGTPDTTARVENIAPDVVTEGSNPLFITPVGDKVFFITRPSAAPDSLWVSDGTANGTTKLRTLDDLGPVQQVVVVGNRLYALAGSSLVTTDGGAPTIIDNGGAPIFRIAEVDGSLYAFGPALCRVDGTAIGRCEPSVGYPGEVAAAGGQLFAVSKSGEHANELAITDLTPMGTDVVKDIYPGPPGSHPRLLTPVGSTLYFVADDGTHGAELWRSDGTELGTRLVDDVIPAEEEERGVHFARMVAAGLRVFFVVSAEEFGSRADLWVSDGTAGGTRVLMRMCAECRRDIELAALGNRVFFASTDMTQGTELWISDGTENGTRRVREIHDGPLSANPSHLTVIGDRLFFSACDEMGCEPWVSDGTAHGTHRVADIAPGAASSAPTAFGGLESTLFLSADDSLHGHELWAIRLDQMSACAGDCNGDGQVNVAELITSVGIALGTQAVQFCTASDIDVSGSVSVAELVAAVGAALGGCPSA